MKGSTWRVAAVIALTVLTGVACRKSLTGSDGSLLGPVDDRAIDDVEASMALVASDPAGDCLNPPGGAPPGIVNNYPPNDMRAVYAGLHDGRIYLKFVVAGIIPARHPDPFADGDVVKSLGYVVAIDADGNTRNGSLGAETVLIFAVNYQDGGYISVAPFYRARYLRPGGNEGIFEKEGEGLYHAAAGGLGADHFIVSFALADLLGTVAAGDRLGLQIWAESLSQRWHHYSWDRIGHGEFVPWTAVDAAAGSAP